MGNTRAIDTQDQDPGFNPSTETAAFDSGLQAKQLELVYTQAPVSLATALVVAFVIAAGVRAEVASGLLVLWLAAQCLQTAARSLLVYAWRRRESSVEPSSTWSVLFFTGSLVSGIVWGCAGFFLEAATTLQSQVLVIMGLAGVLAGAISAYGALLSAYVAFIVPAALIPAHLMLLNPGSHASGLGLMVMIFAAALLVIAKNYNTNVVRSLQLREENIDLLSEMGRANKALQSEVETRKCIERELLRDRQLFMEGPVTVFRWSAGKGRPIEYVSETVSQFGFSAARLVEQGIRYKDIIHPADLQRINDAQMLANENGMEYLDVDYRLRCPDGTTRWVCDYTMPIRDESGEVVAYAGYIMDITERKTTEFELQQEKDRAQVTLGSITDAVITTDVNGQVEYLNPTAEKLTGWECSIARGLPVSRVFCLFDEASNASIETPVRQCLFSGDTIKSSQDTVISRNDGEQFSVQYTVSPIKAASDNSVGVILVFHDLTETRSMERELSYQATHDSLTGLINRQEFEARLEHARVSAMNQDEVHALCALDLDKLKIINDTCSHAVGDEVLAAVADRIQSCLRDSDVLARTGGDEFSILLKNCSIDDASVLVGNILAGIREGRFTGCERSFEVAASIGIAAINADSASVADVIRAADLACYAAKDAGGNRFHVYRSGDAALARRHDEMKWVSRLNNAIEADQLVLYCQDIVPVAESDKSRGHHFEVLLRMQGEDGELIQPCTFLPAAERYNMVTSLDRWVVRNTFEWYAANCAGQADGGVDTIGVNLSGPSMTDEDMLAFIKDGLHRYRINPGDICFEITETAAVANLDAARRFIQELRMLGCRFALDDFGSGLSSFAYLKNLPVDYLKIDGSFVKDMESDAIDCAMVSSINQLGKVIGIRTIAEFVENDAILARLREMGVDFAQGYGISKPVPLGEFRLGREKTA